MSTGSRVDSPGMSGVLDVPKPMAVVSEEQQEVDVCEVFISLF